MNDAQKCRVNGWKAGTRLIGDEGYGETVIEITAVGESNILARQISHDGETSQRSEAMWTLTHREWRALT